MGQILASGRTARLRRRFARPGTLEQQLAFTRIPREGGGAFELHLRLGRASEFEQKVAAHAWKQVVARERGLVHERVHEIETSLWPECHRECNCPIELNDGRWSHALELCIESGDCHPVRLFWLPRAC